MAVVGLALGGLAIGAVLYDDHSDYSDYSNYSDYDNYSNYSDAAERRQRRLDAKRKEINGQEQEVNTYKTNNVNEYLKSVSLKNQSGVEVSVNEVKKDGDGKIEYDTKVNSDRESAEIVAQMKQIDSVLDKIDEILEEGE
ncbi:MAG: hypothetical protein MR274_05525 [Clostridium sp.]|nr:hypothetical protein [Clostridium sp.]